MSKYVIDKDTLTAIGDAIRTKDETTDSIPVVDIPNRIAALGKPGAGEIVLTGDVSYALDAKFWAVDNHLSSFRTEDITKADHLFYCSGFLKEVPFEINFKSGLEYTPIEGIFNGCSSLKKLPKFNNNGNKIKPESLEKIFYQCNNLPTEEMRNFLDNVDYSYLETDQYRSLQEFFYCCYSLRSPAPIDVFYHDKPNQTSTYSSIYYRCFYSCYALDEITNLRVCHESTWTSNAFDLTFYNCYRLKNMTFATQENGLPYVVNWKNQTIDLSTYLGYGYYNSMYGNESYCKNLFEYNAGITLQDAVYDDASYQELKNHPDWYTVKTQYSRYNHDSAVATINSLPDASAYLAANGGTNTIKYKGYNGSSTDGGAINTLTEEEIAIAAAKGWTISFV